MAEGVAEKPLVIGESVRFSRRHKVRIPRSANLAFHASTSSVYECCVYLYRIMANFFRYFCNMFPAKQITPT